MTLQQASHRQAVGRGEQQQHQDNRVITLLAHLPQHAAHQPCQRQGECQFQHGQQRPGRTAQPGQARGQPEQGQGRQRLAAQARLAGPGLRRGQQEAGDDRQAETEQQFVAVPAQPAPAGCQSPRAPCSAVSHSGTTNSARTHPARKNGRKARRNSGTIAIAARRSSTCIKPTPLPSGRPGDGRHAANEIPGHHRPSARPCRCRKSSLPGMRRAVVPAVLSGSARAVPRCPIAIWSGHKPAGRGFGQGGVGVRLPAIGSN